MPLILPEYWFCSCFCYVWREDFMHLVQWMHWQTDRSSKSLLIKKQKRFDKWIQPSASILPYEYLFSTMIRIIVIYMSFLTMLHTFLLSPKQNFASACPTKGNFFYIPDACSGLVPWAPKYQFWRWNRNGNDNLYLRNISSFTSCFHVQYQILSLLQLWIKVYFLI